VASALVVASAGGATVAISAASAKPTTLPPVDHQLCYTISVPVPFKIPRGVVLTNQFSPKGFRPTINQAVVLCNPATKTTPTRTFQAKNPAAHLVCFAIKAQQQPTPIVMVSNQFGKSTLTTGQPNMLCLPSWKSLIAPPTQKAVQPPGLSHFTCYPVQLLPGAPPFHPPPVMLKDEFTKRAVPVDVKTTPNELCVPTKKTIGTHVTRILNPFGHLLCFPTGPTPTKPKVFVKNQFGRRTAKVLRTLGLCVPSRKTIVHP